MVLGLYLVVPDIGEEAQIIEGMCWGIFSAFLFSILSLANRVQIQKTDSLSLTFLQNTGAAITAALFIPLTGFQELVPQWSLLLMLGLLCTTLPIVLLLNSLRYLKAQLVSVVTCLEPFYGILLAAFLLSEIPSISTLIGGTVIMGAVILGSSVRGK